jgi:hypothetical protein
MSIWHIEELKPRPPRAQPQLQSAYTWDKERSLPDLESGFRVQSSDQAWVPYPSYLFVENGVRLDTYDPFAWGTEYESILQNRVDQVDGHLAPLDAPSQRDQIVNHDGFPLSQPPQVPQPVPGQIGGPGEEMGRKRKGVYAEQVPSKKGPPFGYFPKDVSFEQFAKGYEPTEEEKQFKEKSKKAVEDYERKKGEEESMKEEEKETVKEEEFKEEEESKSYAPPKVEPEPESKSYMDVLTPMRIGMRSSQQRSISVSPILAPPSVIPLGYETPVQPSSLRSNGFKFSRSSRK